MKAAKILKISVLNPGNNWITLLNSAKIIKKNAVTPVNFHLYHYAANNPIKYTDPDGNCQKPSPQIIVKIFVLFFCIFTFSCSKKEKLQIIDSDYVYISPGGITEVFSNKEIISLANQGYVIIAAWENSAGKDASPHYATVSPNNFSNDLKMVKVANVGYSNGEKFLNEAFNEGRYKKVKFYYNSKQTHKCDLDTGKGTCFPSINELKEQYGDL